MEAQTACVVSRRNKARTEGVHLRERTNHTGVAEVVSELAACKARAGCRLNGDNAVVLLSPELFAHKRSDKSAEVRAAACAADDDVGSYVVFIERRLGFKTDNALVKKNLVENRAEHIAVAGVRGSYLYRLRDSAAEAAGCAGMLRKDFSADVGGV